ncbi:MAG: DivIVA domain-containing protein [Micrococcales bacterium]
MPLTPEDVVNKRFQPTKFREGYDQDEVDDFLDELVVEMRRLASENEDLRQRLLASEARISDLQRSGAGLANQLEISEPIVPSFTQTSADLAAFPTAVDPESLGSNTTNNLLQLARKLHDDHVREGISKRDALIAEGHATAARVIREAEAQQRVELSKFEQERAVLEHTILELKTFEREYRIKLKNYIQSQLTDLEQQGEPAPQSALESSQFVNPNNSFFNG